jgi:quinolinate synthase
MCYRLKKLFPEQEFIPASQLTVCPNMKKNTLEKILYSLEELEPKIVLDKEIALKAKKCIDNMFELMKKQQ